MNHYVLNTVVCAGLLMMVSGGAHAADPAVKCQASKLKESSKYSACRLKADAKAVTKGIAADYAKCEAKFADKWAKTETKAGSGVCPSEGDQVSMDARITTDAAEVAIQLSGVRFEDTGLGSVIDHQTGLEWQKTNNSGGHLDKDNTYSWSAGGGGFTEADGTAFTDFLYVLNIPDGPGTSSNSGPTDTGCHAGHCDWRIPVIEELMTIVDCSFGNPCIDQSVFGPTNTSANYWSSSTLLSNPAGAWFVNFIGGTGTNIAKNNNFQVRAVRGGS
jgi:hypothetical protein